MLALILPAVPSVSDRDETRHFDKERGDTWVSYTDQVAQSPIQPELECFQGWDLHTTSLGNLFQCLPTLIVQNFFLKSSLNLPSLILQGCYKASLQPSLLQAEQHQLSEPLLIGEVVQPSDYFRGPPLDPLQQLHVLLALRAPELDAVLQVGPGYGWPSGLRAYIVGSCLAFHPSALFHRATLDHITPQPVLILGFAPTQDPELGLVEPHEVHMSPLLQLVQVPLDDILSLRRVNCTTQLGAVCKFAEGVIDEDIKQYWSQYGPLRDTTHHLSPSEHWAVDHYLLDVTIQPVPHPLNSPPIKSISLQFREKDVVGDRKPFLFFFAPLAKFSYSYALVFLTPSLHNQPASLYSSWDTCPCFRCLCISFLLFSLTSMSSLIHASLLPSFPGFLHLGIESSCALWKASLNICQLCSAPLSLRTVSQGSWKFAFLKFKVLTILLACPISLRTVNTTNPRLPPILTSLMSSLAFVTIRSSIASPLAGLSITWPKKLSSMQSRSLLDCLQLALLLFQQMS
ncbi:LOW QUALITY PROTEIN: hypothetical protein QYF61_021703, partial [Mycteria americana]